MYLTIAPQYTCVQKSVMSGCSTLKYAIETREGGSLGYLLKEMTRPRHVSASDASSNYHKTPLVEVNKQYKLVQ